MAIKHNGIWLKATPMSNFWILIADQSNKENYRQINFFVSRHKIVDFPSSEVQTQNESTNVSFRWWIVSQNSLVTQTPNWN